MRPRPGAVAALLCLLASGCATMGARGRTGATSPRVPVSVSSMPSVYGIQLRLAGSAVVRDGWLYVELPAGSVRTYQGTAEAWDLLLRAQLLACSGRGKWRVLSESRPARVTPLVAPAERRRDARHTAEDDCRR